MGKRSFSKRLVADIRLLLWVVTLGGLALAAYCVYRGYNRVPAVAVGYGRPALDRSWGGLLVLPQHG